MTGYGKGTDSSDNYEISVEIKSVNHRFLDLSFRMPSYLNELELKLRERIKDKLSRGSITVIVSLISSKSFAEKRIDMQTAMAYKAALEELSEKLGLEENIGLDTLLRFPDIFDIKENKLDDITESVVLNCFDEALGHMVEYREKEGSNILDDLNNKISELKILVEKTNDLSAGSAVAQYGKLLERLKSMTDVESLNRERLEQELVMISDKVDISEEISRLFSHIDLFTDTLKDEKASGKILNNITQEMHREASTISAKTNLTEISHISVKMKEIIETVREQVQNVE
jgi:uncharacterized protein (TIGR00255 family)